MEKMDNIKVAVYCRPLLQRYEETFNSNLAFSQTKVTLQDKGYTFDYIFPPDTTNLDVYNELVNNRLNQIFEGYNLTIFAYGQTGSGKTYTMGTNYLSKPKNENGLIFLSVTRLFEDIKKRQIEYEFSVNVSFLEVYKEDVYDLLSNERKSCQIREEPDGVKVVNLTETPVTSVAEVLKVLEEGCRCRSTASTAINAHSSRSHSLFTISVEQTHKLLCETKKSKFQLIDLAGSERVDKSETEGLRLKEGIDINRGLLALGKVISALSDAKSHIPYRDSKLTRLLMDSLGGNSYTLMIACISPSSSNTNETLSTLRYASRARKIRNKPIVNEVQIEKPVKQVAEYEKTEEKIDTVDLLEEQKKKMTKDINNLQLKLDELEMINKNLDKSKSKLQTEVQQLTIQLDSQKTKVSDLKKKHDILDHLLAEEKALSECFAQEKNNAEREAHEKEIQISSLKTDLKKRDDKIHDLGRTNQQLQDELDKFINSQGILEDKVQQLTIQLDSQKTKVSDLEEKQKILDHLLAEEKALSEHFAQEKDNAEQEADENETQILSLKAHLKKRGDKIQDLRRTIQQLRDELDKLINSEGIFENKIHELEEAKHILEGQLEEKRYDIEELEDRLKLSENSKLLSIKVNMQAQAQLERDLQARDKQNEEKEKALIKQIEDLTNKLDSQYRKVSDLEKKHEILDHLLAEEKASSKRIAEENGNAEREIREKEKQILSLQTSLVNREEIIEDLEKTNQQLQNELDDFINREEISKKRIHELEKVKRILEDQLEEQRHQIVELEKSKFVLIRFNMQAQARLERHLQARDDQNAENKKNLIEQVQYVAVELESQRTEVSDLEKRQEILDHPLAEEKASSEHIEQEKDNAEREAHQKEIQILSLKTDLKKRDDKIRDLGRTNHQLQDELDKLINSKGILDDKTRKSPDTSDNESSQRAPIPIDDDTLLIHATQHYGFSLHQPELTLSLEKLSDHVIHSYTTQVIKKNVETTLNQLIEESASPDEVAIIQKENLSQNRKTENGSSEFDLMVEEEEQVVNGGEVPRIPELRTHTLPHACVMKVANKGNEIRNFRRRCRMLKGRAVVEYTLYTPQAVERSYSKSANIATWKKILSKYRFTPHSNYPQLLDFAPENCYCSD